MFQQRDGKTLHQAWERYKKLLKDCPHHCQTDEVLGHTFVDRLDETSKMNLDSAYGGSCMARLYSEIQLLLNNFTTNDHNWQGDGESRRAIKQKAAGVIELDDFSTMRANIAKLANQLNRMTMHQTQQMQHVQHMSTCCKLCGSSHKSHMCLTNPESIYYVGTQEKFNQPQKPPQQIEESTNDLLKKLLLDNQQLRTDFRNLERQMGQLVSNKNTRPAGALPSDTENNPQATHESKKDDTSSEPVNVARPPPPFPQRLEKKNDGCMFNKFLSMLSRVQLNIPLVDLLCEIPKYAKYIKDLVAYKRRLTEFETVAITEECTSRVQNKLTQKLKDPGGFTISVRISNIDAGHALYDFGGEHKSNALVLVQEIGSGSSKTNHCDVATSGQIHSLT
ncbi:uncharacterized protein [Nicotiana tomentosiformis]|uniref:uncharacterized protein n=1 Tax=Nicotiana tomentosiformis TaxID=4098 RepID=UPI00388C5BD0